ncbi:hypothetical protein [Streptomyces sp. NPDC051704]|uniref:hypothetical protein n=1 Tax=Streptomyces sp. NPDC051704 TaxID=3365671 RepID=UPI003790DC3B
MGIADSSSSATGDRRPATGECGRSGCAASYAGTARTSGGGGPGVRDAVGGGRGLGGTPVAAARRPALACLPYFAGTVPYVKTMIRERNSRAYRRGSVAYHAAALAAAACLSPRLAIPFAAYLARAAVLPGRALRPPVVGAVEIACSAALLATLVPVFGGC